MKTRLKESVLSAFLLVTGVMVSSGQMNNSAAVPGDHFSLEGALELFKRSASPEEFEQLLNSADSKVNNLDLNQDGDIDYIKVIDRNEGNVHAFILQAIISERESQDIAVIELEKHANGKAVLQIVGDADIYGIETIIEPTEEVRINAGASTARTVVNVWTWPSVQYVYGPYYSVWISPWRWSLRPVWWSPWRPVDYYVYDPYWAPYRPYYSVYHTHRIGYAHRIYRPYRTTSVIVYDRHRRQIAHYRSTYGSTSHRGNSGYRDGHESNNSRTSSYRNAPNERQRTMSEQDNNRSTGRNSNDQSSPGVTRRASPGEQGLPPSRGRSSSVHRGVTDVPQGSSTQQQRHPSPDVRSRSVHNQLPDGPRRTSTVQPRRDNGVHKPAVVQQSRVSRGAQPVKRSGDSGGSQGSGEKRRGRD